MNHLHSQVRYDALDPRAVGERILDWNHFLEARDDVEHSNGAVLEGT
jgi:hypothetical protein